MKSIIMLAAVALTACGHSAQIISDRGDFLTYDHGTAPEEFKAAYQLAQDKCTAKGLAAKQTTSNCPGRCITNFECVKR